MTAEGPKLLLIEDEREIRRFLRVSLASHGYRLVEAATGKEGVMQAASQQPDLVILDLGLPDVDGMEVIRQVREWSHLPIIVLSARGQEHEKVAALDVGGDDYLTKPFGVGELLARIRAALRHAARAAGDAGEPVFELEGLRVDLVRRQVFLGGAEVHLTPIEYRLLTTMIKYAGKVGTHRQLLKEVWGPDSTSETHYLRVYMAQLRRKIEADPARPRFLLTEPAVGYRALSRSRLPEGGRLALFGFGSSAHVVIQIARHRGCEVYVVTRGEKHVDLARRMGVAWAGQHAEQLPVPVDSAILFAPAGELVPHALASLRKGGTFGLAGIHMTPIPSLDYQRHVFFERDLRSVTCNTREDGRQLLAEAAQIPIRPHVTLYSLAEANQALQDLKHDRISGTGVLVPEW